MAAIQVASSLHPFLALELNSHPMQQASSQYLRSSAPILESLSSHRAKRPSAFLALHLDQ